MRMRAICLSDSHAKDGRYFIRSLYFDTPTDKALREKVDGVDRRQKYRIRLYDMDLSFIRLERKVKQAGLGHKDMAKLTAEQAQKIGDGDIAWLAESDDWLLNRLYTDMVTTGLMPKTIVDSTREPFTYLPGNVRVTLDYDIRTGLGNTDFLNPATPTLPVPENPIILEVKWDDYLPDVIRDAVQLGNVRTESFSKYEACRKYDYAFS